MEHEVHALRERAKELRCLYRVGSATADRNGSPPEVFERVLAAMPDGWQRPDDTGARIRYLGRNYDGRGYSPSRHILSAPISTFGAQVGTVEVADRGFAGEGDPFLPEERELITCIAGRLAEYLEWKLEVKIVSEAPPRGEVGFVQELRLGGAG